MSPPSFYCSTLLKLAGHRTARPQIRKPERRRNNPPRFSHSANRFSLTTCHSFAGRQIPPLVHRRRSVRPPRSADHDPSIDQLIEYAPHALSHAVALLLARWPPACRVIDNLGHSPLPVREGCEQIDDLTRVEHSAISRLLRPGRRHRPIGCVHVFPNGAT